MSNQQRPFSWFRLAPFGRQLQPTLTPTPRPTPLGAPAPQPFRPRPSIRPPAPAVTSPPPPPPTIAVPARTLFSGVTTTSTTAAQPALRPFTTYTAPASPAKSVSVPASPITKQASFSSPTSPTTLPITSSSFNLSSPEKRTPAPYTFSPTASPFPKQVASPPKTAAPAAPTAATTTTFTAPTTAPSAAPTAPTTTTMTAPTTTSSPRIIKTLKESPPKYPETSRLFHPPSAPARSAPEKELPKGAPMEQEIKKQMLGQEMAGTSKMNEKTAELKKLPRRLVTLIGENKGAIMVLSSNSAKKSFTSFEGKPRTVGNKEEAHNGEAGSKKKEKSHDMNTMEMEPSTLFINSNVQGVNNSILDDSSLTHHDPGFHLFFSTD